jgi:uncharacterized DUF497 family protein
MDICFGLNGVTFVWDSRKARKNLDRHDGIRFEQAAEAFFDPFFRMVEADRNDEARDAVIGYDTQGRLLFVVHVEIEGELIRIISARKATPEDRDRYDF